MPSTPLADHPSFNNIDIQKIAIDTQLVQRESKKFCPSCFTQTLLEAVITGNASLSELSASLGHLLGNQMSKQAMQKRFSDASSDFFHEILSLLIVQDFQSRAKCLKDSPFRKAIIQDSSRGRLHPGNAELFPGYGNGRVDTSEFKLDLAFNIFSGEVEYICHYDATEQDKSIGKDMVDNIQPNDLVLRDMGYFVVAEFARIEQLGAYWLSRLPVHTKAWVVDGEEENTIEEILKKAGRNRKSIDVEITLSNSKHRCRLVAVRASKAVAKERAKERAKSGSEASIKTGNIRDRWHILITNIDKETCTAKDLMKIYRLRWDVEIQFRAWKQSLQLHKALDRPSSEHHIYALILASHIFMVMTLMCRAIAYQDLSPGELSTEKLAKSLSQFILKSDCFESCWKYIANLRHVKKDKRKRQVPLNSGLEALG